MRHLFLPSAKTDFTSLFLIAAYGALIAGFYGILHDQLTFWLSPEYYTKFKFEQFSRFDFSWHPRAFAGLVGFLATWWVGLIIAWILARVAFSNQTLSHPFRSSLQSLLGVLGFTCACGVFGYALACMHSSADALSFWQSSIPALKTEEVADFRKVGYVHNAGYVGAVLGTIFAALRLKRKIA